MGRHHRRELPTLVAITLLLPLAVAVPAVAAPIDDARAEAGRLERRLSEQGRQVSILAERYNQSRLRVAGVEAAIAKAAGEVDRSARRMEQARRRMAQAAVLAYVSGGTASTVMRLTRGGSDMVVRRQYLRAATADQRHITGELRAAREDLLGLKSRLETDRAAARSVQAEAAEARRRALEAETSQRRVLSGVKGELARLVAEEADRREAEAARRAAEAARQAVRQPAAGSPPALRPAAPPGTAPRGAAPPPPSAPAPAPAGRVAVVIEEARRQLGKPYVYGGSGPANFDCSGLTSWAWRAAGVRLSHSAYIQYTETARVPLDQAQPGDLLFFGPNVKGIHHNALYIGNGQMIEASQTGTPVRIRGWRSVDLVGVGRPG